MKLAVICTGGRTLGYGHFMRSISFVSSAPEGPEVRLFPIVEQRDDHLFAAVMERTTYCRSADQVVQEISSFGADLVVWDTVDFPSLEASQIVERSERNVSISPVFSQMERMDAVFTRNADAPDIPGVKVFKGLQYAIFNNSCIQIHDDRYYETLFKSHLTLGISMGGADAPNKTLRVLESIAELEVPLTIWVLLGEGYVHSYENLVRTMRNDGIHEIILAKSNRSLWNILSNCSVAILAGGLMTIEAVYAGLPSLNIFEKEQHKATAGNEIFNRRAAMSVGIFGDESLESLKRHIRRLFDNRSLILAMRENARGLLDKQAIPRIYSEILRDG